MHPNGHRPSSSGEDPTDATNSDDGYLTNGVWMTKAQLAAVRRISVASADRLIRRQGWRKHPGNDGRARVLVPSDWAVSRASGPMDAPRANPTDEQPARPVVAISPTDSAAGPTDITHAVSTLESAVSMLREQLAVVTGRADQADADRQAAIALADQTVTLLKDAVSRADRAEQGREAERVRADTLRDRVGAIQAQLDEARAALLAATEAERRAEQAEQGREAVRKRAHELANRLLVVQAAADRAQAEVGDLRRQVEAAQIARGETEADAEKLRQAEAARQGRGRLARAWRAWRGG
jgi:hypothetical protein